MSPGRKLAFLLNDPICRYLNGCGDAARISEQVRWLRRAGAILAAHCRPAGEDSPVGREGVPRLLREAVSKGPSSEGLIGVHPGEASGSPIAWSACERAMATDSART
jgi:hypothetical protein